MKVTFKDLVQKPKEELNQELLHEKKSLWRSRMGLGNDQTPPHLKKKMRRTIARLKTALRCKELPNEKRKK